MQYLSGGLYYTCGKAESEIKNLLYNLGIPPMLRGYSYIIEAVLIAKNSADNICTLDAIYSKIASSYYTTSERVERAIRHAVEVSWSWEGNRSLKNYYSENQTIPTNREFLDFLNVKGL